MPLFVGPARSSFVAPQIAAQGLSLIPGIAVPGQPQFDPAADVSIPGVDFIPERSTQPASSAQPNADPNFTPDTEKSGFGGFLARLGAGGPLNRQGLISAFSNAVGGADEFRRARLAREAEAQQKSALIGSQIAANLASAGRANASRAKVSLVNLINPKTKERVTLVENDPRLGGLIKNGFVEAQKASEDTPDNRQEAIDNLVQSRGLSPSAAAEVVDKVVETTTDPVTGQVVFVNRATREVGGTQGGTQPAPTAPDQVAPVNFDQMVSALPDTGRVPEGVDVVERATGPLDNAIRTLGRVPVIGDLINADEQIEATKVAQAFESEVRNLVRGDRGRILAQEFPEIKNLADASLSTFSTEQAALAHIQSVRRQLRAAGEREFEAARDPNNGPKIRREANDSANHIARVLKFTNEILGSSQLENPIVRSREDFDSLPSGAVYIGKDGRRYTKP